MKNRAHLFEIDIEREARTGQPEVIYAEFKSTEQLLALFDDYRQRGLRALATRTNAEQRQATRQAFPEARIHDQARTIVLSEGLDPLKDGDILVVCAGSSDLPIAEEALESLKFLGFKPELIVDVGVAGLERLLKVRGRLEKADVILCLAGMEGTLPTVISGLVKAPVIAVPTRFGYGANFEGFSALLGMLSSCSPGVAVVNIDNGFGAAMMAARILNVR